jgi:hypothetical protein
MRGADAFGAKRGREAVRRRRRAWLLVPSVMAASLVLATAAAAQTVINVSDGPSLSAAIAQVDSNASASYVINFQNSIRLSNAASNTLNAFNTTSSVTVAGNGGGVQRGFFVYSGTVAISNLTIQNAQALGGGGVGGGAGVGVPFLSRPPAM